jgi:hypothetical protein
MALTVENIKIEPMKVTFGEDVMQSELITCVADVAASLNSKYFVFYTTGGTKHYAWFDVGNTGVDPAVSGGTGHEIDISSGASAAAVASALQAVLTAISGFDATADGAVVNLVATSAGYAKPAHEGAAATGFSFQVVKYGSSAAEVGYTDGDIEIAQETSYVDVTAHQSGTEVNSQIPTGSSMSVTINLKETTVAQLRKVLLGEGNSLIPDGTGVSSTEVMGKGTAQQFIQTIARAQKLNLHPVVLASSNLSRDWSFWKAFPKISSLTFSGENIHSIPVEFMIYPDYSKDSRINKMVYGDSTQTLT